jgi:hypothetical protein
MDDSSRSISFEHGIEPLAVADIAAFERAPSYEFSVSVAEIVVDDRCEALIRKVHTGMRADISGTSDD